MEGRNGGSVFRFWRYARKGEGARRLGGPMPMPLGPLAFLYMGTANFARDVAYYRDVLGAELVWNRTGFGAHVAAFRLGEGPLLLLADHRPAPSLMPIYEVADLKATAKALKKRGWKPDGGSFEIPNGPCYAFEDPSGNRFAIFENVRPRVFGREPGNPPGCSTGLPPSRLSYVRMFRP